MCLIGLFVVLGDWARPIVMLQAGLVRMSMVFPAVSMFLVSIMSMVLPVVSIVFLVAIIGRL